MKVPAIGSPKGICCAALEMLKLMIELDGVTTCWEAKLGGCLKSKKVYLSFKQIDVFQKQTQDIFFFGALARANKFFKG